MPTLLMALPLIQKIFWKYVHSQTKLKQSIGGIEGPDGTLTSDESEMA